MHTKVTIIIVLDDIFFKANAVCLIVEIQIKVYFFKLLNKLVYICFKVNNIEIHKVHSGVIKVAQFLKIFATAFE